MENQNTSSCAFDDADLATPLGRHPGTKTVAQLLDDKPAMDDWSKNLEIIRKQESDGS